MTKPTKEQQLKIREESYRKQEFECCGSCRHWNSHSVWRDKANCLAIVRRGTIEVKETSHYGICDLYEQQKDRDP